MAHIDRFIFIDTTCSLKHNAIKNKAIGAYMDT